jgi:putative flippase GtrA
MFFPVLIVGYGLHTWFTFRTQTSRPKFARYTLAAAANFPLWIAGLWLLCKFLNLPIAVAAPVTTVLVFLLNYLLISWAFRSAAPPRDLSSEAQWRG